MAPRGGRFPPELMIGRSRCPRASCLSTTHSHHHLTRHYPRSVVCEQRRAESDNQRLHLASYSKCACLAKMSSKDEDRLGSDARLAISTATEALKTAASNMKDLSKTLAGMNQGAHEINETVMATIDAKLGLTSALCKVQGIQSAIDRASAVVAASASDEQAITTADANPRSEQGGLSRLT